MSSIPEASDEFADTGNGVPDIARSVAALAAEIRECENRTGDASTAAQSVALNVRMVSGMMADLARSLEDITAKAGETQHYADTVSDETAHTKDILTALTSSLETVAASAELIRGIARHTNILALNSAIEAARAGNHGAGFAVIAQEVRALSQQTTEATEKIAHQLDAIRAAAKQFDGALEQVNTSFTAAHDLMDGIAGAMRQQGESFSVVASYTDEAANSAEQITETLDHAAQMEHALTEKIAMLGAQLGEGY